MIFPDRRIYICKYCNRKLEASAGSNSARLITHLYAEHDKELHADQLENLTISDVIKAAYIQKGASA